MITLSLLATGVAAALVGTATNPGATMTTPEVSSVERLDVIGRRNQAQSEATEQTQRLLSVAGLMGDPMEAIYTLPGVVQSQFGQPVVRGTSPDDTTFLLDGQRTGPLVNVIYGSALNPELLRDFKLHSAAYAAKYGWATGGVFAAELRDPKQQKPGAVLDLNMLRTSFLVEGALNDNQSFYAGYRRSTIQYFITENDELDDGENITRVPVLDDYQLRYQWRPGTQHKWTLTALGASEKAGLNLSEASEAGRTNPEYIGDLFLNSSWHSQQLSYEFFAAPRQQWVLRAANLTENEHFGYGDEQFIRSKEQRQQLALHWHQPLTGTIQLITGIELDRLELDYQFDAILYYCTDHQADCDDNRGGREQDQDTLKIQSKAAFISAEWQLHPSLQWVLGGRMEKQDYTNQSSLQPRTSIHWFPVPQLELIASAGRHQRLADLEKILPRIGNPELDTPMANHYNLAAQLQLNHDWRLRLDLYQQTMHRLARAIPVAQDPQQLRYVSDMRGESKGIELLLEALGDGRWSGWLSASYSHSSRYDPNSGQKSRYRMETPLVLSAVINYRPGNHWQYAAVLTGRSGMLYSPIIGAKPNPHYEGYLLPIYGEFNSKRLPYYHRLDIEAKRSASVFSYPAEFTFAIRNVLNRNNVSGYYLLHDAKEPEGYRINKDVDLGIFPYVGMKLWF